MLATPINKISNIYINNELDYDQNLFSLEQNNNNNKRDIPNFNFDFNNLNNENYSNRNYSDSEQ